MNTMTKRGLAREIADRTGGSISQALSFVEVLAEEITAHFERGGDSLMISGFGTFRLSHRKAFTAKSPRTGKTTNVPAAKSLTFRSSAELRSRINRR